MRSKARAEVCIEQCGLPYPRPCAGDRRGRRHRDHRVVVDASPDEVGREPRWRRPFTSAPCLRPGLVEVVVRALDRGPLQGAVHVVDHELALWGARPVYTSALGRPCIFTAAKWSEVLQRLAESGFQWLVASARFGQSYSQKKLRDQLGYRSTIESRKGRCSRHFRFARA